jgi:hypothetical protein
MNEQDAIRNLANGMVSVLVWVENHPKLEPEYVDAVRTTKSRFRSIYRRPWRFKLPIVAQSSHLSLEWVANYFLEVKKEDN